MLTPLDPVYFGPFKTHGGGGVGKPYLPQAFPSFPELLEEVNCSNGLTLMLSQKLLVEAHLRVFWSFGSQDLAV